MAVDTENSAFCASMMNLSTTGVEGTQQYFSGALKTEYKHKPSEEVQLPKRQYIMHILLRVVDW